MKFFVFFVQTTFLVIIGCQKADNQPSTHNPREARDIFLSKSRYIGTWKVDVNSPQNKRLLIPAAQAPWIELNSNYTFTAFSFPFSNTELREKYNTVVNGFWSFDVQESLRSVTITLRFQGMENAFPTDLLWNPDFGDTIVRSSPFDSGWIYYHKEK
jgi:hypothetical protein